MSQGDWGTYIELYGIYMVIVTALIPGLIYAYRKGIKPIIMHVITCLSMATKVDIIFEEMIPNGGTSIKDKIDKIHSGLILQGERLRAHLADTDEAHFETDANGSCTSVNRTYTRLAEREPSELLGHGWQNTVYQEDRDNVVKAWYTAVDENRELSINYKLETPSGKVISVRAVSYKMTDEEGEVIGYLGKLRVLEDNTIQ